MMALTMRLWRQKAASDFIFVAANKNLPSFSSQHFMKPLLFPIKSMLFSTTTTCMRQTKPLKSSIFAALPSSKIVPHKLLPPTLLLLKQSSRNFSVSLISRAGGRMFVIHPSAYTNRRSFTWFIFYSWLAIILGGIPTLYLNITEGHAELVDIPEGYVPHEWEYYKKPVQRFFAHHVCKFNEPRCHEETLASLELRKEELWAERRNGRVYEIMRERKDYHGWFTTQFTRFKYNEWLHDMANEYEVEMRNPLLMKGNTRLE